MKVVSIWNPFAMLIVTGCKVFETRSWAAPAFITGTRIGIASTKNVIAAQRQHCEGEEFKRYYANTGLSDWTDLPNGYLLGTCFVDSSELMTEEFIDSVSDEEKCYGYWEVGNHAWRLTKPVQLPNPIIIRGQQGIYDWKGDAIDDPEQEAHKTIGASWAQDLWGDILSFKRD